jgi:hypothetical protein
MMMTAWENRSDQEWAEARKVNTSISPVAEVR